MANNENWHPKQGTLLKMQLKNYSSRKVKRLNEVKFEFR